jgi:hypothetical protein
MPGEMMDNSLSGTVKQAIEKGRPLADAIVAEIARELATMRDREFNPLDRIDFRESVWVRRRNADESDRVAHLAEAIADFLHGSSSQRKRHGFQLRHLPIVRSVMQPEPQSNPILEPIKDAGFQARRTAARGANKSVEAVAAAGWSLAAGAIIYRVLLDERGRQAAKRYADIASRQTISFMAELNGRRNER